MLCQFLQILLKALQKDFVRFLQISLGSAFELETHIILCGDLESLKAKDFLATIEKIQLLQKRISALIKYNSSTP